MLALRRCHRLRTPDDLRRRRRGTMTLTTLLLLLAAAEAPAEIVTERVLGPEVKTPYNHPASITELANGDLYIAYYGGPGEYSNASTVYGTRLHKGQTKWTMPVAITPRPKE